MSDHGSNNIIDIPRPFMRYCTELWGEVGPESYRALYGFLAALTDIHQEPENGLQIVSDASALRHQIRGKVSRIASNTIRGHVAMAYEICQGCCAGEPFDLEALERFNPDGAVRANFGKLKAWIETSFAEENLPPEFRGKGLGIEVTRDLSVLRREWVRAAGIDDIWLGDTAPQEIRNAWQLLNAMDTEGMNDPRYIREDGFNPYMRSSHLLGKLIGEVRRSVRQGDFKHAARAVRSHLEQGILDEEIDKMIAPQHQMRPVLGPLCEKLAELSRAL